MDLLMGFKRASEKIITRSWVSIEIYLRIRLKGLTGVMKGGEGSSKIVFE